MPFPTGASTITVTGTIPSPVGGTARSGRVVFTPSARLVDSTQKAIYSGGGPATLDNAGHFSVVLLCTDDTDVQPAGWRWRVDEQPSGGPRATYWIDLPSTLGSTVDLSTLAAVSAPDSSAGGSSTARPTGPAGGALTGTYPNPQLSSATIASFDAAGAATAAQTAAAADATTKVSAHTSASDPHGDRAAASSALAAHEADTTNVHGIADTGALETTSGAQAKADAAETAATTAAASDATSKVATHTAAADPHGDRAAASSALTTHTAAIDPHGDRAYTDTQVAGRVPTSRQILAGTGLTGGGTLAADRTLSVDFGTTAGTVAAGDDARFSSTKPWVFDVTAAAYGAVGDATVITDGAIATGTAVLTSPSNGFAGAAPGMYVSVKGAGATGVTTHIAQIASKQSNGQVTLNSNAATTVTGAIVIFGTDDTASVQAAVDAAEAYLAAGHAYAQVYFPPRPYIVAGALSSAKSGNGQITFGPVATTGVKRILEFRGETDGAAAVRHWQQTVPQHAGSCLISFGVYASTVAQIADINAHGNPGVLSGPNEGSGYGAVSGGNALFSNMQAVVKDLAILTSHSAYGLTYGALNLYGVANAHLENVGYGTAGTVASPSTDYTSPGFFGTGLSIGCLLPAPGNNDHTVAKNVSCGGGYTYAMFLTEHGLVDRYMALYCWAGLCAVGNYFGSGGSVHAMKVVSASIEACTHELYIIGYGSQGVGPIIDIDQLSTESSTPNIAGNSTAAMTAALGRIKLTGLFNEAGVNISSPTGIEIVNGQVPAAIKRKTSAFTASPIDRVLVCDTTSAGFTGTLPEAASCPVEYTLRNVGSNTLTVASTSGQLIYTGSTTGATTVTVAPGQTLTVKAHYNGSAWGWQMVAQTADIPFTAGVYSPSRRLPQWKQPTQILTQFQSGHGFTNNAGSTFTANDSTDFILGTQAAKIVTGGTGAAANVSKTGMSAFDTTGKTIRLRLKVDDITHVAGINLFLGTSSFATNYKWIIQGGAAGSNLITSGEWVTVTLNWHDATTTGSPTRSGLTDVRLQITDDGTAPVTAHYQSVELIPDASSVFPNGVVSICFDDCWQSVWDYGKPRLDLYGYPASMYVIQDVLGLSTRLTLTELYHLQDRCGWEIASHAYTDADHALSYTGMTATQLDTDLRALKGWSLANGFRGGDGTAYPLGQYGLTTDAQSTTNVVRRYFNYARTTHNKTKETFPPGDLHRLRAISSISSFSGGYAPSSLTTATTGDLDKAKANQSWLILVFHKITTGAATATTECSQSDFNSIIDAINAKSIPVIPVGDVLKYYG